MATAQRGNRQTVEVPAGHDRLYADVTLPDHATGLVLFAHGSGSSRFSPRNRHVADALNSAGLATVLADLLTAREEERDRVTAEFRFDIPLLTCRLAMVTDWAGTDRGLRGLPLGYFGASTGAAAALAAAAGESPGVVRAVVSRGGRPDLARDALTRVTSPCLFIVGGLDREVLRLNRQAAALLPGTTERRIEIVPGATHLFEEPGTLDLVASLAHQWFRKYLDGERRPGSTDGLAIQAGNADGMAIRSETT